MKHVRSKAPRASRNRGPGRAFAAAVAASMVAGLSGLSALASSASAEPAGLTLSVSPSASGLDRDASTTVTVSGSGYDPGKSIYLIYGVRPASDAIATATKSASVSKLVKVGANPASAAQVEMGADGTFSTTIDVVRTFTVSGTSYDCAVVTCSIYTARDHNDFADRTQDASVPVTFAAPAPTLSVTPAVAGLDREATTTVTVSGSGYDPAKGIYLIYGVRPADDAVSTATRSASVTKLVQAVPTTDTQVKLESDGTFTTTIAVKRVFSVTSGTTTTSFDCAVVACTIYTMRNHVDFADRTQDALVPVTFAAGADPGPGTGPGTGTGGSNPSVSVSPASGLDPAKATTLNVSGSGFDAQANGGVGIYLAFGAKASDYATNAGGFLIAKWVHLGATVSSGQAPMTADGAFTTTLPGITAKYTDGSGKVVNCLVTQCYVVTIGAHGMVNGSQETFTPVNFVGGSIVDDGSTPADTAKVDSAEVKLGGSQTVTASGFTDGETVRATLHSDPYDLGTVVAAGGNELDVQLPGGHRTGCAPRRAGRLDLRADRDRRIHRRRPERRG